MKKLLLTLSIISLMLSSCAQTVFYHDGKPVARFQGDYPSSDLTITPEGSVKWKAIVNHSTATKAQTEALTNSTAAVIAAWSTKNLLK
jgi:hypothetical protein